MHPHLLFQLAPKLLPPHQHPQPPPNLANSPHRFFSLPHYFLTSLLLHSASSFMPQRHHRIHPHRPPRWHPTSRHGHHSQRQSRRPQNHWISRCHPIQQSRQIPRSHHGPARSNRQSSHSHRQPLPHHQPGDILATRPHPH